MCKKGDNFAGKVVAPVGGCPDLEIFPISHNLQLLKGMNTYTYTDKCMHTVCDRFFPLPLFPSSLSLSFSSLTSVDGKNRHPLNDFFHCQHRQIAAVVFSIDEPVVTRRVCCSVLKSYWWKIVVTTAMWTKSVMCVIIMAIGRSVKRDNSYLVMSFCLSTFRQKWMELSHRKKMFFSVSALYFYFDVDIFNALLCL